MYKRLLILFGIMIFAITTSGCVKYSTSMEITKKDEAIIKQDFGVHIQLLQTIDPDLNLENAKDFWKSKENKTEIESLQKKGYTVKDYKNGEYVGKSVYKNFKRAMYISPTDLPTGIAVPAGVNSPIKIKKGVFGSSYAVNLKIDPDKLNKRKDDIDKAEAERQKAEDEMMGFSDEEIVEENEQQEQPEQQEEQPQPSAIDTFVEQSGLQPEVEFSIKIPKKAKKHNATKVDKKKHIYTWVFTPQDIKNGKSMEINIEWGGINLLSIIFLILIIGYTINVVNKNKIYSKKDDDDETKEAF